MQGGLGGSRGFVLLTKAAVCFVIFAARLTQMYARSLEPKDVSHTGYWIKSSSMKRSKGHRDACATKAGSASSSLACKTCVALETPTKLHAPVKKRWLSRQPW